MPADADRPRMPLETPPTLRLAGTGVHGRRRREAFRIASWSLHLYGYSAVLELPDEAIELRPGVLTVVPPGVSMTFGFGGRSEHLFAHFQLEETVAADRGGRAAVVRDPGDDIAPLRRRVASVVGHAVAEPRRAEAALWSLLFDLDAAQARAAGAGRAPAEVVAALAAIETGLHRPLRVADLAAAAGVPHNRLTRGFRAHVGDTVVGHLRRRRVERAVELLTTTDRPVASIACEVGVPDLQAFNKLVRAAAGASPRAVRERAQQR